MRPDQKSDFGELVTNVMAYYSKDATTFLLDVFWAGLSRFDFDDVRRAFDLHAQDPDHGQFAPKVADVVRVLEGSTQTQGMRAWSKVERALRTVGQYRSVVFDDALIHAVVAGMGGWCALCRCPVEELPFRAREFERSYAGYRQRRETPPYPSRLIGLCESENSARGYGDRTARPVLIGDPARARLVMEQAQGDAAAALPGPQNAGAALPLRKAG